MFNTDIEIMYLVQYMQSRSRISPRLSVLPRIFKVHSPFPVAFKCCHSLCEKKECELMCIIIFFGLGK